MHRITWILWSNTQFAYNEWSNRLQAPKTSCNCICSIIAASFAICSILHSSLTQRENFIKFCREVLFLMRNMMVRSNLVKNFCFAAYCCILQHNSENCSISWNFSIYHLNCLNFGEHHPIDLRGVVKKVADTKVVMLLHLQHICSIFGWFAAYCTTL